MRATKTAATPGHEWTLALIVLLALCACSDDQAAQADTDGDIAASNLTFHSKTPADAQPVSTPMEIADISCDTASGTVQTRIDLGEEGHILVRDDHRYSGPAWLIEVDLSHLDILGGKRDNIHPEREEATLTLERNGDVKGHHQFQLHGDLKGMYVVEMDIRC